MSFRLFGFFVLPLWPSCHFVPFVVNRVLLMILWFCFAKLWELWVLCGGCWFIFCYVGFSFSTNNEVGMWWP